MEIVWYGLSSFRFLERGYASIVTDPFTDQLGYTHPRPRADIVSISCDDPTRNASSAVRGPSRVLDGPGEYEIGGVFITGVGLMNKKKGKIQPRRNIIFRFDFDKLTVCHLGGLNHVPSQSQIEALGTIDVLLAPIGGRDVLGVAQAAELISMLEPNLVIPMQYHTPGAKPGLPRVDNFLKEMGVNKVETVDSLKVTRTSLPGETQVVLLSPE